MYLEVCVGALHLLIFDLEDQNDAEGVQQLFQCLTQILRCISSDSKRVHRVKI